ncbi:MAG: PEP/pyruvate-binding domain-containing protein, partial [Candidatus Micrarchaeota archaeon]|nr:PEP/pyruvate-binding domain-containing protein [Candidatus Micrarchaeota archaeon]
MSFVLPFAQLSKDHVSIAGGKGAQLGEMTSAGIPVPPGFVVLTASFEEMIEENNLKTTIAEILKNVDPKDTESVNKASEEIRHIISHASVPKNVEAEIHAAFKTLDAEFVAVRSSATAEDASNASWAGELETYLNIKSEGVVHAVKTCWSSLFTPRAIFYRFEKKMAHTVISVAVVVQKMVQSEVSG